MSKDDLLIDDDFNAGWKHHVFKKEDILWEGKPKKEFSLYFLEQDFYHDVMTGPSSILMFLTLYLGAFFYAFYKTGYIIAAIGTVICYLIIFILPDVILRHSKNRTKYAITNTHVLFQTLSWFKTKITAIPFNKITKITFQQYDDNTGIINFITSAVPNLITRSFNTGERRIFPTFEKIEDPISVYELLLKNHRANLKAGGYVPPETNKHKKTYAKTLRLVLGLILLFFAVHMADFYLFPKSQIEDSLKTYRSVDPEGFAYKTDNRFEFVSLSSFRKRGNSIFVLEHSPVFNTVTDIIFDGKSYKNTLVSPFHGVIKYFYFVTVLIIFFAWLMLNQKKFAEDNEFVMKAMILSFFFVGLLIFVVFRITKM